MLLTEESDLSLVLSLVKLMHCLNTILRIFHWHTVQKKDILSIKIFIYPVLLFNDFLRAWLIILHNMASHSF